MLTGEKWAADKPVKIWGSVVIWVQTTINQKNTHNGARVARADHTVQKEREYLTYKENIGQFF